MNKEDAEKWFWIGSNNHFGTTFEQFWKIYNKNGCCYDQECDDYKFNAQGRCTTPYCPHVKKLSRVKRNG